MKYIFVFWLLFLFFGCNTKSIIGKQYIFNDHYLRRIVFEFENDSVVTYGNRRAKDMSLAFGGYMIWKRIDNNKIILLGPSRPKGQYSNFKITIIPASIEDSLQAFAIKPYGKISREILRPESELSDTITIGLWRFRLFPILNLKGSDTLVFSKDNKSFMLLGYPFKIDK